MPRKKKEVNEDSSEVQGAVDGATVQETKRRKKTVVKHARAEESYTENVELDSSFLSPESTTTAAQETQDVTVGCGSIVVEEKEFLKELNNAVAQLNLTREVNIPSSVISKKSQQLNTTDFYLYYNLENEANTMMQPLTRADQEQLVKNMKEMDIDGMRIVFVLMRMYTVKREDGKLFDLPCKAKVVKEHNGNFDFEFDLCDIPDKLQKIILNFSKRHLEHVMISAQHS